MRLPFAGPAWLFLCAVLGSHGARAQAQAEARFTTAWADPSADIDIYVEYRLNGNVSPPFPTTCNDDMCFWGTCGVEGNAPTWGSAILSLVETETREVIEIEHAATGAYHVAVRNSGAVTQTVTYTSVLLMDGVPLGPPLTSDVELTPGQTNYAGYVVNGELPFNVIHNEANLTDFSCDYIPEEEDAGVLPQDDAGEPSEEDAGEPSQEDAGEPSEENADAGEDNIDHADAGEVITIITDDCRCQNGPQTGGVPAAAWLTAAGLLALRFGVRRRAR